MIETNASSEHVDTWFQSQLTNRPSIILIRQTGWVTSLHDPSSSLVQCNSSLSFAGSVIPAFVLYLPDTVPTTGVDKPN